MGTDSQDSWVSFGRRWVFTVPVSLTHTEFGSQRQQQSYSIVLSHNNICQSQYQQGLVVNTCDPGAEEVEAGGL